MTVEPLPSAATLSADHALVRVLQQAGVSKNDLIHVSGPGSLPALLWLCRQGYDKALHLTPQSPRCAVEAADALLIPHLSEACDLTSLLRSAGCVREGGVLIIRTGGRFGSAETLAQVAPAFGYGIETRICETGHTIVVARRNVAGQTQKVA
jgi:hypothetical protein